MHVTQNLSRWPIPKQIPNESLINRVFIDVICFIQYSRARKIACPTSQGNKKFQSGNCNFFTYVPAGNHAFIRYLVGPGFSINIFVGKMGKINKWQQGMVKLSAKGICLPLGRKKNVSRVFCCEKNFPSPLWNRKMAKQKLQGPVLLSIVNNDIVNLL